MRPKNKLSLRKIKKVYLNSCPKDKMYIVNGGLLPKMYELEREFMNKNFPAKSPKEIKVHSHKIKYLLHPGFIQSKSDRDIHWISAKRLAELYGVSMKECSVVDPLRPETFFGLSPNFLIDLFPDYHGEYKLPKAPK